MRIQSDRFASSRDVFIANEIADALVGRNDRIADLVGIRRHQARTIFRAEILRHVLHRLVEITERDVIDYMRIDLRHQFLHQNTRLGDALLDTLLHIRDDLVDVDRELVRAAQEIFVVLDGLERVRARPATQLHKEIRH